jgi:HEAT repeat protein
MPKEIMFPMLTSDHSARRFIRSACLILLTTCGLFATEPPITTKAWTILDAGLHEQKAEKRSLAVAALGVMAHDKKATAAAQHALEDTDSNVRIAGIGALAQMNARASLPEIKALVDKADGKTLVAIAAALKKFNDPEAYDIYYQILTGKRKGGGSIFDGIKDKKSLETIGLETAIGFIPFGGVGTGAYSYFKQNGSARTNLNVIAVNTLAAEPGRDSAVDKALVQAAFDDKEIVQVAAFQALAKRGNPAVIPELEPAMYSAKPLISYTAAATILHLEDLRQMRPPRV